MGGGENSLFHRRELCLLQSSKLFDKNNALADTKNDGDIHKHQFLLGRFYNIIFLFACIEKTKN